MEEKDLIKIMKKIGDNITAYLKENGSRINLILHTKGKTLEASRRFLIEGELPNTLNGEYSISPYSNDNLFGAACASYFLSFCLSMNNIKGEKIISDNELVKEVFELLQNREYALRYFIVKAEIALDNCAYKALIEAQKFIQYIPLKKRIVAYKFLSKKIKVSELEK